MTEEKLPDLPDEAQDDEEEEEPSEDDPSTSPEVPQEG